MILWALIWLNLVLLTSGFNDATSSFVPEVVAIDQEQKGLVGKKKKKVKGITVALGGLSLRSGEQGLDELWKLHPDFDQEQRIPLVFPTRGRSIFRPGPGVPVPVCRSAGNSPGPSYIYALGDFPLDFAKNHWMIDSGCTDHISPFPDDFAHLGSQTRLALVANGDRVEMFGPGTIIIQQCHSDQRFPPLVLEGVWFAPTAAHRLLSVPTLASKGFRCEIQQQTSKIWDKTGRLVIQASALSSKNNLHWFQSQQITPMNGQLSTLHGDDLFVLWHLRFGHASQNALRHASQHVLGFPSGDLSPSQSPCKGCLLGKMHDRSFPVSRKRASRTLELVHTDLVGPLPTESWSRARYIHHDFH